VREAKRGAHGTHGTVGLEEPAARHLGGRDRVELEAREAHEAELGEGARPLGVAAGELAREGERLLDQGWLARRVAPAEAFLGEVGVVRARVALGHVREQLVRLRPAPESRERACLPVLGGDPRRAAAPAGELGEGLGSLRHLAAEVADPGRPPARLGGQLGARVVRGQTRVVRPGLLPAPGLLRDAPHGVERLRRLRALREAAQQVAVELERGGVVVRVPAPARGCSERAGAERLGGVVRERETGGFGRRAETEGVRGLRAQPEDARALARIRRGERVLCLVSRSCGVALLESRLRLVGVVEQERGVGGADALGEPARAAGGQAPRARAPQLASQVECGGRVAHGGVGLGQIERRPRPADVRGGQGGSGRGERSAGGSEIALGSLEPPGHQPGGPDPDAVGVGGDQPPREGEAVTDAPGLPRGARPEIEGVVLEHGMLPGTLGEQRRQLPGAARRLGLRGGGHQPRIEWSHRARGDHDHPADPPRRAPHQARPAYHASGAPAT